VIKVFIQNNPVYYSILEYTLSIFSHNKSIQIEFITNSTLADFTVTESTDSDLPIALDFYSAIKNNSFNHSTFFKHDCCIYTNEGQADILATCFYMINSLQEYNSTNYDEIGRFKYTESYQFKFNNITENIIQQYFDKLAEHPKFKAERSVQQHSSVFISHDIDNINSAWIEDGFAALKKGQVHHLFRLFFNAVIQKPDWLNMDRIMAIHNEYDVTSTFFWLANKGRLNNQLTNADYDVRDKKVQETIFLVQQKGFENGIHKSISDETFESEATKLNFKPIANRYHYLKFKLPDAFNELEQAGIKLDASLGFAEHYGFRNSYGQAFQPFNLAKQKAYNLVEVPLHIMDRTFHNYMKIPTENISNKVISFFETNKYNCTLSLLWHNNFFNSIKYGGYLKEYKKIIAYLYENNFKSLTQKEIIDTYLIFKD
jgi:uncharacterized protein DUF7033